MVYYEPSQPELYHGRNLDPAYHRFAHRHRVELVHAYDEAAVTASRRPLRRLRLHGAPAATRARAKAWATRIVPASFYGPGPGLGRAGERLAQGRRLDGVPGRDAARRAHVPLHAGRARALRVPARSAGSRRTSTRTRAPAASCPCSSPSAACRSSTARSTSGARRPRPSTSRAPRSERAQRPRRTGSTTAAGPTGPRSLIDAPATEARAMAWAAFKHDVDLYFYWHGVHWQHNRQKQGERQPERLGEPDHLRQPRPAANHRRPGLPQRRRRPLLPRRGEGAPRGGPRHRGPVSSVQLANLRRGLQDHLYLTLARQRGPARGGGRGAARGGAAGLLGRGRDGGLRGDGRRVRGRAAEARGGDRRRRRRSARDEERWRLAGAARRPRWRTVPARAEAPVRPRMLDRRARPVLRPARAARALRGGRAPLGRPARLGAHLRSSPATSPSRGGRSRRCRAASCRPAARARASTCDYMRRALAVRLAVRLPGLRRRAQGPGGGRAAWTAPRGCSRCSRWPTPRRPRTTTTPRASWRWPSSPWPRSRGTPRWRRGPPRCARRPRRALDNILETTELVNPEGGYHESMDYMRITWAPARPDGRAAADDDGRGPRPPLRRVPQHGADLPLQGPARRLRPRATTTTSSRTSTTSTTWCSATRCTASRIPTRPGSCRRAAGCPRSGGSPCSSSCGATTPSSRAIPRPPPRPSCRASASSRASATS